MSTNRRAAVVCECCGVLQTDGPTPIQTADEEARRAIGSYRSSHDGDRRVEEETAASSDGALLASAQDHLVRRRTLGALGETGPERHVAGVLLGLALLWIGARLLGGGS